MMVHSVMSRFTDVIFFKNSQFSVFIPGPIIMGALFDSSCLLWLKTCGESSDCVAYNMDDYRQDIGRYSYKHYVNMSVTKALQTV